MARKLFRIGIVAPASRIEQSTADRVTALAREVYGERVELVFHPQCFLSDGHFAGTDEMRADAFVETANDADIDALWWARGGYGSNRITDRTILRLRGSAQKKLFMGYSDAGFLLAGLYRNRFENVAHGPVAADILRDGGDVAVKRALAFLVDRDMSGVEPNIAAGDRAIALNIAVLSDLLGTRLEPDFSGLVLMLEDVSEYLYAIDRAMFHITESANVRRAKGIRLGRVSAVPDNDPPFGQNEEEIVQHWCKVSGIPYLGRADIGHDVENKIVPFGKWAELIS